LVKWFLFLSNLLHLFTIFSFAIWSKIIAFDQDTSNSISKSNYFSRLKFTQQNIKTDLFYLKAGAFSKVNSFEKVSGVLIETAIRSNSNI